MRALSVRQPWAWAILHLGKDVENRSWRTAYRGRFAIHASKSFDAGAYAMLLERFPTRALPRRREFQQGGIVGTAELVDCVTEHESWWFEGPYGFVLQDVRPTRFVAMSGKLRFFKVPVSVVRRM